MSNPSMEHKIKELMELKRMKEELEAEITNMEDEIKAAMGDEETLHAGAFKVSWKTFTSSRLDSTAYFGSEAYSKEELIAEIGASALVNVAGLETAKSFRNSTAYIQNWLRVLNNDKRFIVSASGKAEKAVNLILGSVG